MNEPPEVFLGARRVEGVSPQRWSYTFRHFNLHVFPTYGGFKVSRSLVSKNGVYEANKSNLLGVMCTCVRAVIKPYNEDHQAALTALQHTMQHFKNLEDELDRAEGAEALSFWERLE